MRLGLNLGYWGAGNDAENLALAREADRLGYAVCWAAEAYGSDAPTVLAWVAAQTERIDIGSAVMQIPARTPALTAMTAATLDTLSGGRFRLGLGVSGPQVSEGWHGVRFDHPLGRTREYVEIVRMALRRESVSYAGRHWTLPLPDGPGKAIRLTVHPGARADPVYLAAVGPAQPRAGRRDRRRLAGHLLLTGARRALAGPAARRPRTSAGKGTPQRPAGRVRRRADRAGRGGRRRLRACADPLRPYAALYVGGMGSRERNFYNALARRMGFEQAAAQVQDLYLARRHRDAAAAVPQEFIDSTSLLGPPERIRDRLQAYAAAGVTTLTVSPAEPTLEARVSTLRTVVEAVEAAGLAS